MEAGSNSFEIHRRLLALGLRAVVLESAHVWANTPKHMPTMTRCGNGSRKAYRATSLLDPFSVTVHFEQAQQKGSGAEHHLDSPWELMINGPASRTAASNPRSLRSFTSHVRWTSASVWGASPVFNAWL
jgi:hypothetical protein